MRELHVKGKMVLEFPNNILLMNYLIEEEVKDWYEKDIYRVSFGADTVGLGDYLYSFGLCDGTHSILNTRHRPVFGGNEYIVCSAIDYNGIKITGYRHHNCFETLDALLGKDKYEKPANRLFLTSKNRYVDRAEGYKIARENNQLLLRHSEGADETLISENLYFYEEGDKMR